MENMCSNCGFYKTPPLFWGGSTEPSLCDCPKEKSYSEEDMQEYSEYRLGLDNYLLPKEWFERNKKK